MKENEIPKNYRPLEGSERRPSQNAKLLGPADAKEVFRVTIALRRRPDGPPVPDFDYYARTSPKDRPRLSPEEFARKYGADPADIARVVEFAESLGLTIVEVHASRRTVIVSGTVAQMNKAFAVSLGRYEHGVARQKEEKPRVEVYRGRNGFIHIPDDLTNIIIGVFGLDNRRISKRNVAGDPPNTNLITVPQVTKLYNFPANSAAGQTIAIFSEGGYQPSDITQYYATLPPGFAAPTLIDVTVDASNDGSADPETTQDICIAATAAPGAAIAIYFTTYSQVGWFDLVGRVAHPGGGDPVCSALSSSFYVANGDDLPTLLAEGISVSWLLAVTLAFQDAAIQGVTVCIASGDTGTKSKLFDGKAHVQYPASDPWVLGIGGTTVGNITATSYDEYVWNDNWGATGGGISDFFAQPPYQGGAGVPPSLNDGHVGRGVPDVSANGSGNSGYPMIVGGGPFTGNGTSASAPLWAGLIAVINAAIGAPVGFVNPAIYTLGSYVFRDILGAPGPADNREGGVAGYPAGTGWDACTGWGSPNGRRLLAALAHEPVVATVIAAGGNFGGICRAAAKDELLTINNAALPATGVTSLAPLGLLSITNIISSSPDFLTPSVLAYPLLVGAGESIDVAIRFQPTSFGLKAATLTIISNDPTGPHSIHVSGVCQAPRLSLVIADSGNFGNVCVGSFVDESLTLNNSGPCLLTVTGISSSSGEFLVPGVFSYPLTIGAGNSLPLPIRFQPVSFGAKSATLTVDSDDPGGARVIKVSGQAPSGKLAVTGSTFFGGVKACCREERLISICNVGHCPLHVSSVDFKRKSHHWKLINNPFPATLHPGSCLSVVILYKASEKCPRACELVITSDDPVTPVKVLDVMGYTIWDECGCDKCRKKSCEKRDCDPCGCEEHAHSHHHEHADEEED